jgi:hypothetical protein
MTRSPVRRARQRDKLGTSSGSPLIWIKGQLELLPVPLNLERESYLEHRTGPVPDLDCHPVT